MVGCDGRMAWPRLTSPNYESLINAKLACNHGHYSSLDGDEALLESLVREDDYRVMNDIGDHPSRRPNGT